MTELSQRPEQVEDQASPSGGRVDALPQRPEPHPPLIQPGHRVDQVPQRPAQPVQPPHHQRVPRAQLPQDLLQLRPPVPVPPTPDRSTPGSTPPRSAHRPAGPGSAPRSTPARTPTDAPPAQRTNNLVTRRARHVVSDAGCATAIEPRKRAHKPIAASVPETSGGGTPTGAGAGPLVSARCEHRYKGGVSATRRGRSRRARRSMSHASGRGHLARAQRPAPCRYSTDRESASSGIRARSASPRADRRILGWPGETSPRGIRGGRRRPRRPTGSTSSDRL